MHYDLLFLFERGGGGRERKSQSTELAGAYFKILTAALQRVVTSRQVSGTGRVMIGTSEKGAALEIFPVRMMKEGGGAKLSIETTSYIDKLGNRIDGGSL